MNRTYECPRCGTFEHYRKDSEIIDICPMCGDPVKQRFGGNFKLTGSGFYSTDTRSAKNGR